MFELSAIVLSRLRIYLIRRQMLVFYEWKIKILAEGIMKKLFVRSLFIVAAGLFLFSVGGCRQPRARWDWTTQDPPRLRPEPEFAQPGDEFADLDDWDEDELAPWESMEDAPSRLPGDLVEVEGHPLSEVIVYFAFDRSTIGASERPKIEEMADYLMEHQEYHLVIEGHCDERGSAEYNRGLGERRALAVKEYLTDLGISPNRLNTVSYGIERPEIPNAATEAEHAKNRRAEFLVGTKP